MSRKQVYGITLTSEERRMAGYDRTTGFRPTTQNAADTPPQSSALAFRVCAVTLPDGTTCQAQYTRSGYGGYSYAFQAPFSERVYGQGELGSVEAIETRAQELVNQAWRQAQKAEQKAMRLPSAPSHLIHTLDAEPQLQRRTAQRFAGLYAVCLRYPSGALTPLAAPCERPHDALAALRRMQEGSSPPLALGICCRWARRWQRPRFVADVEEETGAGSPGRDREAESDDGPDPDGEEEEEKAEEAEA